ncbi:TetR/AcrR family transcriptional regulator [Bradyrhizobium sp. USDA 4486]
MRMKRSSAKPAEAYHHGDLRQTLLDLALSQIELSGPEAVSLAALARELGVSQSAPYRHFQDRDRLLAAVAADGFRMFAATLRKSTEGLSGRRAVSAMAKAYVAFGTARPGLYNLMFASGIVANASENDDVKIHARESFAMLVGALAPSRTRKLRALRIWAGLHGAVTLNREKLLNSHVFDVSFNELIEDIIA